MELTEECILIYKQTFGINNSQRSLERLQSIKALILSIIPLVNDKIKVEVILDTLSSKTCSYVFLLF